MSFGQETPPAVMDDDHRKALGAWYTPDDLVERVVLGVIDATWLAGRDQPVSVLDPACGDGRFLQAVRRRIESLGGHCTCIGVDIDPRAVRCAAAGGGAHAVLEDALHRDWGTTTYDLVIGNPPFRSQLAATTSRGGASRHGGGPYADAAAEFLALASRLADPDGGRFALVLPHSLLAARDAGPVRDEIDRRATMFWSWTSDERWFDAQVRVCALGFEAGAVSDRTGAGGAKPGSRSWAAVVNAARGIPQVPIAETDGRLGDRARLNANFRDEYYGLVPAVADDADGPPLITSGLIDPGSCRWGTVPVRFNKRDFVAPRVVVERLDRRMRAWALARLVPKVLVANQTSVIEAVADADGSWLPGVPVVAVYPGASARRSGELPLEPVHRPASVWEAAAVLTSPYATTWAWDRQGGTGLSASTIRLSPTLLAELPWPAGELDAAVEALRRGKVIACGNAVDEAYGVPDQARLEWWRERVERSVRRPVRANPSGAG